MTVFLGEIPNAPFSIVKQMVMTSFNGGQCKSFSCQSVVRVVFSHRVTPRDTHLDLLLGSFEISEFESDCMVYIL